MERVSMADLYIRPINVGTLLGYIFVFFLWRKQTLEDIDKSRKTKMQRDMPALTN